MKDLQAITLVATVPEMLVVAENVPAKNMSELIALAKAQPGKLNFASSGPGSLPHLAGELLKLTAKIDIVHVPYRGAAPAVNDMLGGQVQMVFLDLPIILPQVESGKLKPIAIGSPERSPTAKDVPTTAEAGMPDLKIENWYGPGGARGHACGHRRHPEQGRDRGDARSPGEGKTRQPGHHADRRQP